jgi:antitoxin VapB
MGRVARDTRLLNSSPFRVGRDGRRETLHRFLEDEVWPQVPEGVLGQPLPREEREAILGYGPEGV